MHKGRVYDYVPATAPEFSFYLTPQRRAQMFGADGLTRVTGAGDAGDRWDAEDIDRIVAAVQAGLPEKVATLSWFGVSDRWKRRLRPIIDGMSDRGTR